ncbi:MAG: hypothetical protein HQM09_08820 [Candidatus Riflebacteria bacterium]|nr:hypothetical protein [Candidatus Riflebacteria bacterium]
MNYSRAVLFSLVFICFALNSPAFCEKYSKEELRRWIESVDNPLSAQRAFEMEKNSPKALIELILLDDPNNFYGRTAGIVDLARLAEERIISLDDFFDVDIQLLSKLKNLASKFYDTEHRQLLYVTAGFGVSSSIKDKKYRGSKNTLENFISCIRYLAKYNLISASDTANLIIQKISEAKEKLQEKQEISSETVHILQSLVKDVNSRKDDVKEDAQVLISNFVDNIINRSGKWQK